MPDWSKVEQYPENTITCRCGREYRSHSIYCPEAKRMVVRKPCPGCGRSDDFWKISSDPETMTL